MKICLLLAFIFNINASYAGISDTCKEESQAPEMICANIVFPEMLCGNEDKAIDYIDRFSAARKNYIIRMFNKGRKYYPKVCALLKKQGVPEEFWVLMALESAFEPKAVSKAGAVGFWQFMNPVAKEYGLKIDESATTLTSKLRRKKTETKNLAQRKIIDERTVFLKSTNAAARYLKDRSRNLNNNWLLIAASYNWGVGNVWNAMKKTGLENPTFWDIKKYVPQETLAYVMNFITLNVIYHNYEQFVNGTLVFYDMPINKTNDFYSGYKNEMPLVSAD